MERELDFPNPIERTDLPTPRKRWKWVVGGGIIFLGLCIALLPQILSSRIGRNLVKMRLESKYRGQAWITSLKTSWRGPTIIQKFSMTDPEGRQIKFDLLKSPMSCWGLLTGGLDLKDAQIDKLHVEYVVDYGDGSDTLDRMQVGFVPGAAIDPTAPRPPAPSLPAISGNFTLHDATFILTRGQVLGQKQFRTEYRSARFSKINGTLRIASLDKPFECNLAGVLGSEEDAGSFTLTGTASLGADGKLDAAKATSDLWLKMQNVPNATRGGAGSLGWILLPLVPAEDYAQMLGPTLTNVEMNIRAGGGKVTLARFDAVGRTKAGKTTHLSGQPVVNLLSSPRTLEIDTPTVAQVQMTRELSKELAYLNPFLRDAAEGTGELDLRIDHLSMPLPVIARNVVAQGSLAVHDLTLVSGAVGMGDNYPRELTTQWQAITGNTAVSVKLNQPLTRFAIQHDRVTMDQAAMTLDGSAVVLHGPISLSGPLELEAQLGKEKASLQGTIDQPRLELAGASQAQRDQIERHVAMLRERKAEDLLQTKSRQVDALIKAVDRANPGGKIDGKTPGWEKANWDK